MNDIFNVILDCSLNNNVECFLFLLLFGSQLDIKSYLAFKFCFEASAVSVLLTRFDLFTFLLFFHLKLGLLLNDQSLDRNFPQYE